MQLMSKFQWWGGNSSGLASKVVLTLPTGAAPNPDRALDIYFGDGRYKLGSVLVYDRSLGRGFKLSVFGGYTVLLPHRTTKRVPLSPQDSLSADKMEMTRGWGHSASTGESLEVEIPSTGLTLSAGYNLQYQRAGDHQASALHSRVALIDQQLEPEQLLGSVVTAVNFSTVSWYRQKRFPMPFQTQVVYSHPVRGRNVPTGDVVAGEMVLFF